MSEAFASAVSALLGHEVAGAEGDPILAGSKRKRKEEEEKAAALAERRKRSRRRKERLLLQGKDHRAAEYDAKERRLVKVATKGVVTLFNAVAKQQKETRKEERAREEAREEAGKPRLSGGGQDKFLSMLRQGGRAGAGAGASSSSSSSSSAAAAAAAASSSGGGKDEDDGEEDEEEEGDDADEDGGKAKWGILKDDFMMGAKMKDWDKDDDSDDSD